MLIEVNRRKNRNYIKDALKDIKISKSDIIAKEALPAAYVTFSTYLSFGVILTLIPDWSDHLGIINKGTFFIAFTIAPGMNESWMNS